MAKKKQNLVLKINKSEIDSLVGNAGEFEECAGLTNSLFKLNTFYLEEHKFTLTENSFICMYKGILNALNGVRYPTKSGKEYTSLLRVKETMEKEYQRQTSKVLSL